MKRFVFIIVCMALFPAMINAQQYEGQKNKKGQPDGQGVITFNHSDCIEKLEGIFKKGMPVQGKSMRFDRDGRLTMEFEGTFKPKKKGVFTSLSDLLAYGNAAFFYYEGHKTYKDNGYFVKWGNYNGNYLQENPSSLGVKNNTNDSLSPEGLHYYEYLFPLYAYDLMKDNGDISFPHLIKHQGEFDVYSIDKKMEHYTMINISGANSNNLPDGVEYGLACKGNDKQQLCYFKGEFENGQLKKIITLKQYFQGGKVRNLYINSVAQKITPFFSEKDFDEYLVIDGRKFSHESGDMEYLAEILREPQNRNNKDIIERAKVICAYKLAKLKPRLDWNIYMVLKNYPEIANAKNVVASWDGSKIVNIKDAYLEFLRKYRDSWGRDRLFYFYYIYNDWGPLTEDELFDTEHNYILINHPDILNEKYKNYFPNGRYAGKDFYKEAWAEAYINNYKRMLIKNDSNLWVDRRASNISFNDWLHYPRLSQGIGGYREDTGLSSLIGDIRKLPSTTPINQRKASFFQEFFKTTRYVFEYPNFSDLDTFRSDVFDYLKEGDLNDEAKTYRSLLDAIGAASQIDDAVCNYTNRTDMTEHFQNWLACHLVVDYLIDGVKAARTLSSSTPEIRPACKKAEELIKEKYYMLAKKVFVNDDAWMEVIKKNNRASQANKEAEEKLLQEIENLELPKYTYEDDSWQDEYYEESRQIYFEDLTEVSRTKIWRAKNGSYYKTIAGAFYYSKYKTEKDAIIAAYAYLKYGEVRQKGRIK